MAGLPPIPNLYAVYQLYADGKLEEFVDAANEILGEALDLSQYDRIRLLLLVANCLEDPEETSDYFERADRIFTMARLYQDTSDPNACRLLDALEVQRDLMQSVVDRETRAMIEEAYELTDNGMMEAGVDVTGAEGRMDISSLVTGAEGTESVAEESIVEQSIAEESKSTTNSAMAECELPVRQRMSGI